MLGRIHCLLLVAALALLVAPASAAAVVAPSNSTSPGFQLNLARRFSSTVAQLKEKRGPSKTSRVGLAGAKKRTLSDDLLDMIKGVSNAFAAVASSSASPSAHALAGSKPSASASWRSNAGISQRAYNAAAYPTSGASQAAHAAGASQSAHKPGASQSAYKPGASQAAAANPGASQATAYKAGASQAATAKAGASQAAAAKPGASQAAGAASAPGASQHAAAAQPSALWDSRGKAERVWDYVKRAIQEEPWETLDSRLLCPLGETACPIFPRMGTYECLDTRVELESCGGCTSKGFGEDCTSIRGAQGVTCESGACHVYTCQSGWALDAAFKRPGGGKGKCRKVFAQKERRAPVVPVVAPEGQLAKREEGAAVEAR